MSRTAALGRKQLLDRNIMLERDSLKVLDEALAVLEQGFASMPEFKATPLPPKGREVLLETARRMRDNYPYPHPLYAGQMLKPPYAMARLAYMLALWINPNNHALDVKGSCVATCFPCVAGSRN